MLRLFLAILLAFSCVVSIATTQEEIMHNQGAAEVNDKALIVDMVRAAGSHSGVNINPLLDSQEGSQPIRAGKVIKKWIDKNGESIVGTRGGPFNPTDQYVTTYKRHKIYVHVLSWGGKNNIRLPAIIDRMVKNAWLLENPEADGASRRIVRQHP